MSIFSGKCDFADHYGYNFIIDNDEDRRWQIEHTEFHIDGEIVVFTCAKDLVPYYPCVVGMSTWSGGKEGSGSVYMSSESYVDREERERISYRLSDTRKAYRKLKRNKEKITAESLFACGYHFKDEYCLDMEICRRVADDYEGATTSGLHFSYYNYMRERLYDAMVEAGYTSKEAALWVYNHQKTWGKKDDEIRED